ncbi:MAG TPA: FGGY family carbohydrate kinase, partial [Mycobacteriales bacterium]|nr:FGGY family carbohydrate kinase [Mycobacteriales bacterium]
TDELWLGVDVGTGGIRALVMDDSGSVVGSGRADLDSIRAEGRHEQDPAQWWSAFGAACRSAVAGLAGVRGLAICSTSGTFTLASSDGALRTPGIMYDDARAGGAWALDKLRWLLAADPSLASSRLLHCAEYLGWRLCGLFVAADWSHSLKSGYDLEALSWPSDLGVPSSMLPTVVAPGSLLGEVSVDAAAFTGLAAGTPLYAGMTDSSAAQIAAGALSPGQWNSVLGTTLALKGVSASRLTSDAVYSHRHPDGGWLPGGASSVGAGILAAQFPSVAVVRMDAAASEFEPSTGIVYPLIGHGERFPFNDSSARYFSAGSFVSDVDRYAATLQGVAFVERLCLAAVSLLGADVSGPLLVTGGGSRSPYWRQIRADVLGRPVLLPSQAEGAYGMAILASARSETLAAAAARRVRIASVCEPRDDRFEAAYHRFLDALDDRGYLPADLRAAAR